MADQMTRRGRLWRVVAVLSAALGLAAPAGAAAAGSYVVPGEAVTYAQLRGTHGFQVGFAENDGRHLEVAVTGHHSTTIYWIRGGAYRAGRVAGSFGRRGAFHLHFVAAGGPRPDPVPHWCVGKAGTRQRGYLVGRFRFRGERGYTRVRGHRVPAVRESWPRFRCRFGTGAGAGRANPRRASFDARVRGGGGRHARPARRSLSFAAVVFRRRARPAGRRVRFTATTSERRGAIGVRREVKVVAPEATVAFPGGPKLPEAMTVDPPAPFSGGGAFARTPESTFTWTGDLAVSFPGLGQVRLTGPRFATAMCALRGCVRMPPSGG